MEKIIDDTKKVLTVTDGAVSGKMALNGTPAAAAPPPAAVTIQNGSITPTTEPTKMAEAAAGGAPEGKKLNLAMTAAEMRAQLAARKKYDPKSEVCDLRKSTKSYRKCETTVGSGGSRVARPATICIVFRP